MAKKSEHKHTEMSCKGAKAAKGMKHHEEHKKEHHKGKKK
jgi:hypothetical protein